MCLGIPMQVVQIDGLIARCEAKGAVREINLLMLQHEELKPKDYIVVQSGYAIEKISAQDAQTTWEMYDRMLALADGQADE